MRERFSRVLLIAALLALAWPVQVWAQYESPNFTVNEVIIGTGGELEACSDDYCSRQTAGELGVGLTEGTAYQAQAGFNTTDEPLLEVDVDGGTFDLGVINLTTTGATSTTFSVRNYVSNGYVVRLKGSPPSDGAETLNPINPRAASAQGTEQFGINLRANTTPPLGVNPQQEPDASFSYGTYATDYGVVDEFKFLDDDIIAQSTSSTGKTTFTMTMIANAAANTPTGTFYSGAFSLVVVATF